VHKEWGWHSTKRKYGDSFLHFPIRLGIAGFVLKELLWLFLFSTCGKSGLMPLRHHELRVRIHLPLIVPTLLLDTTTYDWEKEVECEFGPVTSAGRRQSHGVRRFIPAQRWNDTDETKEWVLLVDWHPDVTQQE
jgi:hypothetical protein